MKAKLGIWLSLCVLVGFAPADQESPTGLLVDIGFLGGPRISGSTPPVSLNLGLELTRPAHFKLFQGAEILDAGLLNKGFNVIAVEAMGWFQEESSRTLILEFKEERGILRKHLDLEVKLDRGPERSGEPGEAKPPVNQLDWEYSLSLYVDQRLLSANRKQAVEAIVMDLKIPPMPRNYDPFDPDAHRDPMANAVSILDALGYAAQLAGKLFWKREETRPASSLRPLRQIRVEYLRKNPQGMDMPVIATLTLNVEDAPGRSR